MSELASATTKKTEVKSEKLISHKCQIESCQSFSSPFDRIMFLQRTIGNQTVQRLIKSRTLQAKLRIGKSGDRYEQEADRVVDAVMRMPEPKVDSAPSYPNKPLSSPCIQRVCPVCGEELQKQPGEEEVQAKKISSYINEVDRGLESRIQSLKGGSQPMPQSERAFFEPRFGYDFSHVKLHNNSQADVLNRSLQARAFTVGQDIFFRNGEYNPSSRKGQELLAHELTHTIQQSGESLEIQSTKTMLQCLGDITQVPSGMSCPVASSSPSSFVDRIEFNKGASALTAAQKTQIETFIMNWRAQGGTADVRIDGYSSKDGTDAFNWQLSCDRVEAVKSELLSPSSRVVPSIPSGHITIFAHGETDEFSSTPGPNRCTTISSIAPLPPAPAPAAPPPPPAFVCGPDVTSQVTAALSNVNTIFGGWNQSVREDACGSLDSLITGGFAWDIIELHNNAWIHINYRPACATVGGTPSCGSSVQIGNECYYAGSPNYVVFGVMCKLCFDHYMSNLNSRGVNRFTKSKMLRLINYYKGTGFSGLSTPSANFAESQQWAEAGYDGWPSGGTPPAGDRSNCSPVCPTPYSGRAFRVHWYPHII